VNTTSPSLLSRVRNPGDHTAWREFDEHYRELLLRYCRRRGVPYADAEDVVQAVFADLVRSLPQFTYQPDRGRFRDYLYRCVSNTIADWARRPNRRLQAVLPVGDALAAASGAAGDSEAAAVWQQEWENHHFRRAMQTIRRSFDARNVALFERSISGATVAELAREFDMNEAAVHKARQRIRDRMSELIAQQVREEDALDDGPS